MIKLVLMVGASTIAISSAAVSATFTYSYSGSLADWTVPKTGEYAIDAYGAQGGGYDDGDPFDPSVAGGRGIEIRGTFNFTAGEMLEIAVGGAGGNGSTGGGGGGSFVAGPAGIPLIVAGGGGGTYFNSHVPGDNATATTGNGQGGAASDAGGGGGFFSGGGSYYGYAQFHRNIDAQGGGGFPSLAGGSGVYSGGGFGGGGGSGYDSGGGGGGFEGGYGGQGGYSFNGGRDQATLGYRTGNGLVSISAVPEPTTWSFILTGLGFLGYVLRRRVSQGFARPFTPRTLARQQS